MTKKGPSTRRVISSGDNQRPQHGSVKHSYGERNPSDRQLAIDRRGMTAVLRIQRGCQANNNRASMPWVVGQATLPQNQNLTPTT